MEIRAAGTPVFSRTDDIANARLEFPASVANVAASRVSLKKERKWRIFQEHGYLSLNLLENEGVFIEKSEALKRGEIDPVQDQPGFSGRRGADVSVGQARQARGAQGRQDAGAGSGVAGFRALRQRETQAAGGRREGLRALQVAERVMQVMRKL